MLTTPHCWVENDESLRFDLIPTKILDLTKLFPATNYDLLRYVDTNITGYEKKYKWYILNGI